MRQQLREQHEAMRALKGQLAASQQEQQQLAEVRFTMSSNKPLATHIPHCPSAVQSTLFFFYILSFYPSVHREHNVYSHVLCNDSLCTVITYHTDNVFLQAQDCEIKALRTQLAAVRDENTGLEVQLQQSQSEGKATNLQAAEVSSAMSCLAG